MATILSCRRWMTRWVAILLLTGIAASPAVAKVDAWDTSQKNLITSCDDWNQWLTLLVPALEQYKNSLGNSAPEEAQKANVQKFLDNVDGLKCTQDAQLNDKKEQADLLLRPINIVKALAKLWVAGTELYGLTLQLILKSLEGHPETIPFKLINATLDFLIEGAKAAGDKENEKKLKDVKKLKDAVEKGKDVLDNLKKALEKLRKT